VQHALVDEVSQELCCRNGNGLVVALVGALELGNHTVQQQLTNLCDTQCAQAAAAGEKESVKGCK
jgi:hypothetical protein